MEILESILRKIGVVLGAFISFIRKIYEQDKRNRLLQEQMVVQQALEDRARKRIFVVQVELFEVFQHHHYPKLVPIKVPTDIRIDGYRYNESEQSWYYFFTVDKTDFEEIVWVCCKSIKDKMDTDIFSFKKYLEYRPLEEQMMYPDMISGIRIVNLENRLDCVRITVVTAINP